MSINDGGFQAKPILKGGEIAQLLDPSLGSDYDHDQIERMILAANLCIRHASRLRPEISIVSLLFASISKLDLSQLVGCIFSIFTYLLVILIHHRF